MSVRSSRLFSLTTAWITVVLAAGLISPAPTYGQDRGGGASAGLAAPPAPRVGELPERRTATSTTRRNADKSFTTTLYGEPVNFRAPDGSWQPIDATLHPINEGGYAWRSGANAFEARFKDAVETGFSEFRVAGRVFRITAEGAAPARARVDGSTVSYAGAFPGANLTYTVGTVGVEEVIELAGPDSPASYTLRLSAADKGPAPSVQRRPDGSYEMLAGHRGPRIVLPAPVVYEAAGAGRAATPAAAAKPALAVRAHGRELVLTLSLDAAWLRAPGRHFPVRLDPTIVIDPTIDDASFRASGSDFGSVGDRLRIGGEASDNWRAALLFDLANVPADAQLSDAFLRLYYDRVCVNSTTPCGSTSQLMDVHRMTGLWESCCTTSDRIRFDPTAAGSYQLFAGQAEGWMIWRVTDAVRAWLSGAAPNFGLLVKKRSEVLNSSGPAPPSGDFWSPTQWPRLEVSYRQDGGELLEPETLHANGAELAWTRYTGTTSGAPFSSYEVHRSASQCCVSSAETLLTTIRDPSVTSYRDTTAAPGGTFTYWVRTNGSNTSSYPRTVTLPASGQARKTLRPGPQAGRTTDIESTTALPNCTNNGRHSTAQVGTPSAGPGSNAWFRALQSFDLANIPVTATVSSATASLWQLSSPSVPLTVEAHRITRPWKEGTGVLSCSGDGATWAETEGGQPWSAAGGDYDPAIAAQVSAAAGERGVLREFDLTALVRGWVSGSVPNNGFLLRAGNETPAAGKVITFASDDYTASLAMRPKLVVTYADDSEAQAPRVSLASPTPGSTVLQSPVLLAASAEDDRRVNQVEFLVDGASLGVDTGAPFERSWTPAANGTHSITLRATDDAGNVSTSAAVNVTVDVNAAPTAALTAPAADATVGGDVTLSATASDDRGVASVAFLVDGVRVGAPVTAPPYTLVWKTQDPLSRVFNGQHELTAAVTDTSGQVQVTAPRTFSVNNLGGAPSAGSYSLNDPATEVDDVFPPAVGENTGAGVPVQDPYTGGTRPDGTSGGSLNRALADAPRNDGAVDAVPLTQPSGSAPCVAAEAADKVVDRSVTGNSKWCSTAADKWVQAALPSEQTVATVVLRHAQAGGEPATWNTRDFDIQTSRDGAIWSTALQVRGNTAAVTTHVLPAPARARYVKVVVLTPAQDTSPAARIYELEVYLTDRVTPTAAAGSAACAATEAAPMAIDGSLTTKWCSLASSKWVQAQAPSAQAVNTVVVKHAGAGGESATLNTRDFDIQTSTDGATWVTRLQVRGNTASVSSHRFTAPVAARYVKLVVVTPTQTTDPAARIYEIELYNTPVVSAGSAPPPLCPAGAYCPTVDFKNTSGVAWSNSAAQVWYRWYASNGAVLFEGRSAFAFPPSFAANDSQRFPVIIQPPALPPGVEQGTYRLRVDAFDPVTGAWLAARGNAPLDNPVIVVKTLATRLGLERFFQYDGDALGAGMASLTNVANGNMLLRWTPFFSPGRGLSTMTDLTYNSLEDHSKSPAGNNFSLSMSGLIRFGEPIDIHPNKADEISGQANKWVELTDGDGTTHRFTGTTGADGVTRWQEPPGVNLYLRSLPATDTRGRWALTRPDKVTFFFDADGFPTLVEDRNGNRITFVTEDTPPGEDPGGPKKRIIRVTDPGGRSFLIDYWSKAEAKKAHVRGKIQTIVDHSGSKLDFDYYDDGNLLRLTQRGGLKANGTPLADRSFVFTYTTSNGAGPAIPNEADRVNPEPKTANQSTRIYSVRDPRGSETRYAYYLATDGPHLRWKLKERSNRLRQATSYTYDLTNRVTAVTMPLARSTSFTYDTTGKVTTIVNAKNETTQVHWTTDFKVDQLTEPTGKFTTYTYNDNGYLTSLTNQTRNETTSLAYFDEPVDSNDSGNHLSRLRTVTTPKGVATAGVANDFQWAFSYDADGNVDRITDPTGAFTDYDYNLAGSPNAGTVAQVIDANRNPPTVFESYHPSGQPAVIRDPLGRRTRFAYNADGQIISIQDPNHENDSGADERAYKTFFDYDAFGRLGRQSAPKSTRTERGTLLWSSVDLDANDNVVSAMDAHFGFGLGDGEDGAVTTTSYDAMDRPLLVTGPDTSADPAGERSRFGYDAAGRLISATAPKGVRSTTVDGDHTTTFGYDALDRVIRQTVNGTDTSAAQTRVTQFCYDLAGDLRSLTSPRAGPAVITCPANGPADAPFTAETDYDAAHRPAVHRDDLGHTDRIGYDLNGNVETLERDIEAGRVTRTRLGYSARDELTSVRELFDSGAGREVRAEIVYDANGNRSKLISPRGIDFLPAGAAPGTATVYVTEYRYNARNQLTLVQQPFDSRDGSERQYVHYGYDANGNLTSSSLPVTTADPNLVGPTARTVMEHFDPGWIRTADDPLNPKARFDYTPQGWQASRQVELVGTPGTVDPDNRMFWTYDADGQVKSRTDRNGQISRYDYDEHDLLTAGSNAGVSDPAEREVQIQASYTGFDEPDKVRHRKGTSGAWTFSDYAYDPNSNVTLRLENGKETGDDINGPVTQTEAPRRIELAYDNADWLSVQLDKGTTDACEGDSRTVNTWWSTGWERQRDIRRAGSGCGADSTTWPLRQSTTWTHFDNGLLRVLETRTGTNRERLTERHEVGYLDGNGDYVNGNRTRDRYVLERAQGNTATTCRAASPCDAQYDYDARDRLIRHQLRAGKVNTYRFDEAAQLLGDNTIRAGNITTEIADGRTTTRRYTGSRLTEAAVGGVTVAKYWYEPTGELDCVTTPAGSQANCSPPAGATPANLIADNTYDYLQRLTAVDMYNGQATPPDSTDYIYDALDRVVTEAENHVGTTNDRTTTFTFLGLTALATEERQTGAAADLRTKTFSYDAYGNRITMNDRPTGSAAGGADDKPYTYGYDVHGSTSQLIDEAGNVRASYGYTAYGGVDSPSSDPESMTTGDTNSQAPINPYRFAGKRMDSGTAPSAAPTGPAGAFGYDMGARRYGPDLNGFLQQDMFAGALGDLGLALDPLTQNRYALAGGNPISYIESDGHMALADGGGGGESTCGDEYGHSYPCSQGVGAVAANTPDPPPPAQTDGQKGLPPDQAAMVRGNCGMAWGGGGFRDTLNTACVAANDPHSETARQFEANGWEPPDPSGILSLLGVTDVKECTEGSVSGCAWTVLNFTPGRVLKLFKFAKDAKHADEAADVGGKACSFTAETEVLMADGSRKPISSLKVGDKVLATDPETGETSARTVTAVWVHEDSVVAFDIDGTLITTTEDHPFWNETDQRWERAEEFDPGDRVRTADGRSVPVHGLRPATRHDATSYNLTVAGPHTYYVLAGDTPVLVHNQGGPDSPDKGAAGVQRLIQDLLSKGYVIRGTEISMTAANGVNVRLDVVAEKDGKLSLYDAKNGPNAKFTKAQKPGYESIESSGGKFYGPNAEKAGLGGKTVGPTRVNIAGYGGYPHC
jgi:RHS repeat-associated protein